ncbi:MAG: hypothetical protein LBG76_06080 [Treponema sp.]|nr:hypothetical protein [Treponema sp.]
MPSGLSGDSRHSFGEHRKRNGTVIGTEADCLRLLINVPHRHTPPALIHAAGH